MQYYFKFLYIIHLYPTNTSYTSKADNLLNFLLFPFFSRILRFVFLQSKRAINFTLSVSPLSHSLFSFVIDSQTLSMIQRTEKTTKKSSSVKSTQLTRLRFLDFHSSLKSLFISDINTNFMRTKLVISKLRPYPL